MHEVQQELLFHPETAPKHSLTLRRELNEVVEVEDAVAFIALSRFALAATGP